MLHDLWFPHLYKLLIKATSLNAEWLFLLPLQKQNRRDNIGTQRTALTDLNKIQALSFSGLVTTWSVIHSLVLKRAKLFDFLFLKQLFNLRDRCVYSKKGIIRT